MEDLVSLKFRKQIKEKNKKVISTSVFLPQEPKLSFKFPFYFVEMIKLVETFSRTMGSDYILRIYYDRLFDLEGGAISYRPLDEISSKEDLYKFAYNNVKGDSKATQNIIRNKELLKKIIALVSKYLLLIRRSRATRYSRIELVSFECPVANKSRELPGHPDTFGSLIRFFPMFDADVAAFFSINCRHAITPMMKQLISEWFGSVNRDMFVLDYDTNFIKRVTESIFPMRGISKGSHLEDPRFLLFLNSIHQLKGEIFGIEPTVLNEKQVYSSNKKYITYLERYSLRNSIAAGLFGLKRTVPYFKERVGLFKNLLTILIENKNDFRFGIDELLLKVTLAFEVGSCGVPPIAVYKDKKMRADYIQYTDNADLVHKNNLMLMADADQTPLSLGKKPVFVPSRYHDAFDADLMTIKILNGTGLFVVGKEETPLRPEDTVVQRFIRDPYTGEISFDISQIFFDLSEQRKLIVINSKKEHNNLTQFISSGKNSELFTVIELANYKICDISKLLELLIKYYNREENNIKTKVRVEELKESVERDSSQSSSPNSPIDYPNLKIEFIKKSKKKKQ